MGFGCLFIFHLFSENTTQLGLEVDLIYSSWLRGALSLISCARGGCKIHPQAAEARSQPAGAQAGQPRVSLRIPARVFSFSAASLVLSLWSSPPFSQAQPCIEKDVCYVFAAVPKYYFVAGGFRAA